MPRPPIEWIRHSCSHLSSEAGKIIWDEAARFWWFYPKDGKSPEDRVGPFLTLATTQLVVDRTYPM
jgi:hypothetical protein